MSTTDKATPRPWEAWPVMKGKSESEVLFVRQKGDVTCSWIVNVIRGNAAAPNEAVANANAALIVRAVNNIDQLVAALEAAERFLTDPEAGFKDYLLAQIADALASARGGTP